MQSDRLIGCAAVVAGLLVYFVLIPVGIVVPGNVTTLSLSPDFWPRIVAGIVALMGLIMVLNPAQDKPTNDGSNWNGFVLRLPRLAVVLGALFGFYFAIPIFGMVVPGMLLIFGMMLFAGERRLIIMATIAVLVPLLLYLFFVHVAQIPIPLGLFESLRG